MFKSASTVQFQNTSFTSPYFQKASPAAYDLKSPFQIRSKKTGVKFDIENDKENTQSKQGFPQKSQIHRKDKHTKTWTHQVIPLEQQQTNIQITVNQLKQSKTNLDTKFQSGSAGSSYKNYLKPYETDGFGYSSKKYSENKNLLQIQPKFERSYKQCKSMKTLPSFSPDDQEQISAIKPKKQRKFQKLQAYNQLLKSSQDLIQRYRKLQQQKTKLKSDLKSQIQSHTKSSKKITFLEQTESSKKFQNFQNSSYTSIPSYESKSFKNLDFSVNLSKYDKYDSYDTKKFDSKYESGLTKSTYGKGLSKTFNSSKSYLTEYSSPTKYESKYENKYESKYESKTYDNGFGLSKSGSTRKLCMNGLDLSDFQLGNCLGSGAFGQVFPARHKKTKWLFALKKVKKQKVKHMLDQFIQEIKIQLFLDHPNIVKLYSFFDDQLHFYILMEYMEGGSLYTYLKKQKALTLEQTSEKLKEVCEGLKHMHDNSILHRDIKPENIVMSHNVSKLCDFGWSAICKDRRTTYCGTLDYVCPQIIEGDGYDDSVDIWCIGVLAYELIVGKTPFYNISRKQTMKKILDCSLQYPSTMPQVAATFVKRILKKNPQSRRTIEQVLKDPLLKLAPSKVNFL